MIIFLLKRLWHAIPILIGVNIITFFLFFTVNTPDDMARMHLGGKYITSHEIESWKAEKGYDKPLFYQAEAKGISRWTETIFFQKSIRMVQFDFGQSDAGRDISDDILTRMLPSLLIAIPSLLIGLWVNIMVALLMVMFRQHWLDKTLSILAIFLMSISSLFYIIGAQYFIAIVWRWVPVSGYSFDMNTWKFLILPVMIGVIGGLGSGMRWYRSLFLEEASKEYVKTAYAKGLTPWQVLKQHIFPNGLIPILTGVVVILPLLFLGSLLTESFFGIPGLGSYTIEAIQTQDFSIVRSMVFLGSVLYIIGLILTELSYAWADPRIQLQ